METLSLICGIIALVLAIPTSINAARQLEWISVEKNRKLSSDSIPQDGFMKVSESTERILLTLDSRRSNIEGSLEKDILDFESRLPPRYRDEKPLEYMNGFVWNPGIVKWSAGVRASTQKWSALAFATIGAITLFGYLFSPVALGWGGLVSTLVLSGGSAIYAAILLVQRHQDLITLNIVDEYLEL